MQNDFESPRELAKRLSWPLARVRRLIRDRELRHVKLGSLYLVPSGAIEEYLAARTVMPHPPRDGGSV